MELFRLAVPANMPHNMIADTADFTSKPNHNHYKSVGPRVAICLFVLSECALMILPTLALLSLVTYSDFWLHSDGLDHPTLRRARTYVRGVW